MKNLFLLFSALLSIQITSLAQLSNVKILPSVGYPWEQFGSSVSILGDYSIIGTRGGNASKAAYIFRRAGATWIEEQKLIASSGNAGDEFGCSVSISEGYAIVGDLSDDDNGPYSGVAYIFRRDGPTWVEEQKLLASDGAEGDVFGFSVFLSDGCAVVGAPHNDDNGNWSGSAYIFRKNGATWIEEQKLTAWDGNAEDKFGSSVSISGDCVIIAAVGDSNSTGSAYIFRGDGATWVEEQKLLASDGWQGDEFGFSLSISGGYAIVGAPKNFNGISLGSAYIFRNNGATWIEEQILLPSDGYGSDEHFDFGCSVCISDDVAIIGAVTAGFNINHITGAAYIFRKDNSTELWLEEHKLLASGDRFGCSVSISGNYAIVGAEFDDENGEKSGSAYIYSGFIVGVEEDESENGFSFNLDQNYPNPFNPTTTIEYTTPIKAFVELKVYDILGKEVAILVNRDQLPGKYKVQFNSLSASGGQDYTSGIYFYQLKTGSFIKSRKMVLLH